MRRILLCLLPILAGCAGGATDGQAPAALVVGMAEQNYRLDFATQTKSISLVLSAPGQPDVTAKRRGCSSFNGFFGVVQCDLSIMDRVVVEIPPGRWTLSGAVLDYYAAGQDQTLRGAIPGPVTIDLRPGQVIYLGDYLFASDADTGRMALVGTSRDDAGAQRVLAPYRQLRTLPVTYAGPATR